MLRLLVGGPLSVVPAVDSVSLWYCLETLQVMVCWWQTSLRCTESCMLRLPVGGPLLVVPAIDSGYY